MRLDASTRAARHEACATCSLPCGPKDLRITAAAGWRTSTNCRAGVRPRIEPRLCFVESVADQTPSADACHPVRGDAPADPAVPADAVTASASGLDPHISPAYAALQIPRIARVRGLSEDAVRTLMTRHTDNRTLGFLGEPGVNVLELNLALDARR